VIAKSLVGNYRDEHLFALQQAVTLYDAYQSQLAALDQRIEAYLARLERVTDECPPAAPKRRQSPVHNQPRFDARTYLYQLTGVDLTRIDGIEAGSALALISEIGTDMTRWKSANHFASWLGLCPGTYSVPLCQDRKSEISKVHALLSQRWLWAKQSPPVFRLVPAP
jgi:transposase